jgi:Pup-like protein
MKQEHVVPARSNRTAEPPEVEEIVSEESDAGLLSDIDDLLDEIDAVLEEQAVLVNYRQRSGQ